MFLVKYFLNFKIKGLQYRIHRTSKESVVRREEWKNEISGRQTKIVRSICAFMIFCRHVNIGPQYQADLASVAGKLDIYCVTYLLVTIVSQPVYTVPCVADHFLANAVVAVIHSQFTASSSAL